MMTCPPIPLKSRRVDAYAKTGTPPCIQGRGERVAKKNTESRIGKDRVLQEVLLTEHHHLIPGEKGKHEGPCVCGRCTFGTFALRYVRHLDIVFTNQSSAPSLVHISIAALPPIAYSSLPYSVSRPAPNLPTGTGR